MTSLTTRRLVRRPARRLAGASALVLALALTGCSGDDGDGDGGAGGSGDGSGAGSSATDEEPATTVIVLKNLGKDVSDGKRERVKSGVAAAVDPLFDEGFLGSFPRTDYTAAFAGFTPGAAATATGRDLALLTNEQIGEEIDAATATFRKVRLELFTHNGRPRGATAYFTLDFDTEGSLEESRRVTGQLYLTKDKGAWQVFGYDVDGAVTR